MGFKAQNIGDLSGKVAIVTGANSGIGKVTSLELARKGCHVIMACRSKEKALPEVEEIKKITKNDKVEFMKLDLNSLEAVRGFSEEFISKNLPLHMLINNAGIMYPPFQLSADGIESQFATNHVGHFYLTMLLLPVLESSQPSRIVNVSSILHSKTYPVGIQFDKINDKDAYDSSLAYGQSKLCNVLFTKELARRLEGKRIYVLSLHPGYVATDLQRNLYDWGFFWRMLGKLGYALVALSPEKGALTQLYAATSPEIEEKNYRGEYFVPIAKRETPSEFSRNPELAKKLWSFTEDLLKQKLRSYQSPFENEN